MRFPSLPFVLFEISTKQKLSPLVAFAYEHAICSLKILTTSKVWSCFFSKQFYVILVVSELCLFIIYKLRYFLQNHLICYY